MPGPTRRHRPEERHGRDADRQRHRHLHPERQGRLDRHGRPGRHRQQRRAERHLREASACPDPCCISAPPSSARTAARRTPTAPFPRVTVSGQPVVTLASPYVIAGCAVRAARRQRTVRDGPVRHLGDPGAGRRRAGAAAGQHGRLRADRDAHAEPRRPAARGGELTHAARLSLTTSTGASGRPRRAIDDHVRDLIEQLLFTQPGERVNRPEFGSGVMQLVFAAASPEVAATAEFLIRGALQQWLADRLSVADVKVRGRRVRAPHPHRLRRARHRRARRRRVPAGDGAMIYHCCDERRRRAVRRACGPERHRLSSRCWTARRPLASPRQRTLLVRFVKAAPALTAENFEITGGERIDRRRDRVGDARRRARPGARPRQAERAFLAALPDPDGGDRAPHQLQRRLFHLHAAPGRGGGRHRAAGRHRPAALARSTSPSRSSARPTSTARPRDVCPEPAEETPQISYLAKDYRSFRRLMLDRMAQITAASGASATPPTSGVALVEMLAYVGDRLSYAQDAVATEAYLGTARRRVSVRRHARLVDYAMHDGANARVWVQVLVAGGDPVPLVRADDRFLTRLPGVDAARATAGDGPDVRPPAAPAAAGVRAAAGQDALRPTTTTSTSTTGAKASAACPRARRGRRCAGDFPNLAPGDVLVFEEMPRPAHRPRRRRRSAQALRRAPRAGGRRPRGPADRPADADHRDPLGRRGRPALRRLPAARTDAGVRRAGRGHRSATCSATSCWPTTASAMAGRASGPCPSRTSVHR